MRFSSQSERLEGYLKYDMKSESNSETILEKETDYSKIPLSVKDIVFSYSSETVVKSVFNHFKFQVDSDGVVAVVGEWLR